MVIIGNIRENVLKREYLCVTGHQSDAGKAEMCLVDKNQYSSRQLAQIWLMNGIEIFVTVFMLFLFAKPLWNIHRVNVVLLNERNKKPTEILKTLLKWSLI